ncbi:hypothetical protein ACFXKD_12530 [Nocardiopsis aegyptia]|uniref:hypothetical protein n=1 Tax=Nocardiopsis aegyptia TaxID=220378 RepID=UPI0036711A47
MAIPRPRTPDFRPTPAAPTTSGTSDLPPGRWRRLFGPVPGVPRWAVVAAYTAFLSVLPSGLWRSLGAFTEAGRAHGSGEVPTWIPMESYVIALSVLSLLVAFTAVGLIAPWGESFPRWIPGLRGRPVPVLGAVIPAFLGALTVTVLWTAGWVTIALGTTLQGDPAPPDFPTEELTGWPLAGFYAAYLPLLLWGPLLGAVTVAYWRRRTGAAPARFARADRDRA